MKLKDEDFSMEFLEGDQRGTLDVSYISYHWTIRTVFCRPTSCKKGVLSIRLESLKVMAQKHKLAVCVHIHFLSNIKQTA